MKAYLFGPLRLEDAEQRPLPLPATTNGRILLAYLLLHADQPQGRSSLAALLAPDEREEKARRTLTQALWQIRRALPNIPILTVDDTIQLDSTCIEQDVAQFDILLADVLTVETVSTTQAAQLMTGIDLYRADLLNDLYDDWVYLPREQRRERYLQALELVAVWEKQNGRFAAALDHILKLTQADPLRETAHQEAIRLYAALNRPQAARHHYEQFHHYLQTEMGLKPEPATQQLIQALASSSDPETAVYLPPTTTTTPYALSNATPMPLIGRDLERSQLIEQINRLNQGQGGFIFLSGVPGVGKSHLLQVASRDAHWRGLAVAHGSGQELATAPPFALFQEALSDLLTPLRWQQLQTLLDDYWLALAAPLLGHTNTPLPTTDFEPLEALTRLLLALGQLRPLLLILDDIQWADMASLDALVYLSHRLQQQPVLIMLAFRSREARAETAVWQTLDTLDTAGLRLHLQLEPLNVATTTEFISRGLGLTQPATLFSQQLFTATGGLPLLLLESLRTLHDEGLLYQDEQGHWHTPYDGETADYTELHLNPDHPGRLDSFSSPTAALLERRLRQLPTTARHTLELAAVMGRDVQFGWLLTASVQPQTETLAALSLLVERQFLQETPRAYRFSHDKIRESIYQEIPEPRRRTHHGAIAAVIARQQPTAIPQLAYHYYQAAQWSEALHYTLQAADQARNLHALTTALTHYATARQILLEHGLLPAYERDERLGYIFSARQRLLLLSGQTDQQAAELSELRALADRLANPMLQADALLKEANLLIEVQAKPKTAVALAQQALELAQHHHLPLQAAEAWGLIGEARYTAGAYQEAATMLRQATAVWAESAPDHPSLRRAYVRLIYSERMVGRLDEAYGLTLKLLALGEATGNQMVLASARTLLATFHDDKGQHEAALAEEAAALEIFRRIGARLNAARTLANMGYTYWFLRDYGQAIAMTQEALTTFHQLAVQINILISYRNLAALHYEVGQMAQGEAYTEQGLDLARRLELTNYETALQVGRAHGLLRQGLLTETAVILDEITPWATADEELPTRARYWSAQGIWLLANSRFAAAIAAFEQASALFAQEEYADLVIAMRSFRAFALWQLGEQEEAHTLSTQAVAALEQTPGGEFVAEIYWHHAHIIATPPALNSTYLQKAYAALCQQADSLPDPTWHAPFWDCSLHALIQATWQAAQPRRERVWLPRLETAVGQRIDPVGQRIEVEWTPFHPDDNQISNKVTRRRQQLTRLLAEAEAQGARPTSTDLAAALDSSQPTIKRDLAVLRQK